MQFTAVLGNAVGVGFNTLASRFPFLFPVRYHVTKSDLRCFIALAGMLPAISYVHTCRSNSDDGRVIIIANNCIAGCVI